MKIKPTAVVTKNVELTLKFVMKPQPVIKFKPTEAGAKQCNKHLS
jgi:hypothetical protein